MICDVRLQILCLYVFQRNKTKERAKERKERKKIC